MCLQSVEVTDYTTFFASDARTYSGKIRGYFSSIWNVVDTLAITLFFIAFTLRLLPVEKCFCVARIIFALDLSIWYMRTLDIFFAVQKLGPKLVMIAEMIHDLKFFVFMLTVFMFSFGVSAYALIHGVEPFSWHLPRKIFNIAYWEIFGEVTVLDMVEDSYGPAGYLTYFLLVCYMAVAATLLVNLLIAMF
ncbi:unnamed protein product, partial [Didymodactylos carnosus]